AQVVGIAIDRMAAPEEAERVLLEIELIDLRPRRHVRQRDGDRSAVTGVVTAEHVELPEVLVALVPRAVIAGAIDRREQLRPNLVQRERRAPRVLTARDG